MKIQPDKFYSLLQVQKLTKTKSREYLPRYIKDGMLNAIVVGGKKEGTRYAIKGEWVTSFMERKKKGLIKGERFTIAELKIILDGALDYCKKNKIKTLKEFEKSVRNLK